MHRFTHFNNIFTHIHIRHLKWSIKFPFWYIDACCLLHNIESTRRKTVCTHLMVRFSITSGKLSSSALSSSKVIEPLLSLSADSNSASVKSSNFSSGRVMALSCIHDFKTVLSSSGSMDPLPISRNNQGKFSSKECGSERELRELREKVWWTWLEQSSGSEDNQTLSQYLQGQ